MNSKVQMKLVLLFMFVNLLAMGNKGNSGHLAVQLVQLSFLFSQVRILELDFTFGSGKKIQNPTKNFSPAFYQHALSPAP